VSGKCGKDPEGLIPRHGGYRNLKSFQVAQLAYDVTVRFCDRYISKRSRTHDQMVQAARSGVQNIAESSQASGTSKKFELKLTSVARASLEELRLDYEDFLRQRGLALWERDDPRRAELVARRCTTSDEVAAWVREVHERGACCGPCGQDGPGGQATKSTKSIESGQPPRPTEPPEPQEHHAQPPRPTRPAQPTESTTSTESTLSTVPTKPTAPPQSTYPEIAANAALLLIAVACGLLERQLSAQAESFENEGGFTERLYARRQEARRKR
jgi:four helix bundle suffix protein